MTRSQFSKMAAVLAVLLFTLPMLAAGKRRAVGTAPPAKVKLRGTVIDATSGVPVRFADVIVGSDARTTTDIEGKFEIDIANGRATSVQVTRSGYSPAVVNVTAGQTAITISMTSLPTVRIRTTDNRTFDFDVESSEFAYLVPFSGYPRNERGNFCIPGNVKYQPHRSEIKRIVGPATEVDNPACCTRGKVMKARLELKTGEAQDVFFNDSCFGFEVDFVGRDHTTGEFVFLKFTEIAEIVFP